MKTTIFTLLFCLASVWMYGQTNLITNPGFEDWTGVTPEASTGLNKGTPTGWTFSAGNGNLVVYQYDQAKSGNYSVFLKNTSATAPGRLISPATVSLTAGKTYKFTCYMRGKVTLRNVSLVEETVTLNEAASNTASDKNLFPGGSTSPLNEVLDLGTTWTKKEFTYTVKIAGKYRIVIWPMATVLGSLDGANAPNYFLVDDTELIETVDLSICTLDDLRVKGSKVDNFGSLTTTYSITLPNLTTPPAVSATATDPLAGVAYQQAQNLTGTEAERTATVTVTAQDGTEKKYYVIFTKTDEWVREGFASVDFPSVWTMGAAGTWIIDANAAFNKGTCWGANSLRPKGSDVTDVHFIIPNLSNAGTVSFYLKSRDTNADATLYVDYQKTTDDPATWTTAQSFTDIYADYTLVSADIKQNTPVNIRFRVTKNAGPIGYQIDDLSITPYAGNTSIGKELQPASANIICNGSVITLQSEGQAAYRILTLTGQIIDYGTISGSKNITGLPAGIYIVCLQGEANIVRKARIF